MNTAPPAGPYEVRSDRACDVSPPAFDWGMHVPSNSPRERTHYPRMTSNVDRDPWKDDGRVKKIRALKFLNVLLLGVSGGVALVTRDVLALVLFLLSLIVAAALEVLE